MAGVKQVAQQLQRVARSLTGNGPRRLSVRTAWLEHERYVGQAIVIAGGVRAFEAGTDDEYFTLDDGPQRVGLRGDSALLRGHVGQRVRVVGVLTFKPGVGIFVDAERVQAMRG